MTESTYLKCVNVHKHKCVCVNVCVHKCMKRCQVMPQEGTQSLGARVTGIPLLYQWVYLSKIVEYNSLA